VIRIVEEHRGLVPSTLVNVRFVCALDDGARVEMVLYRGDTLCISSQVGCAVGCPFCASGANGLYRPLSLDELTGQIGAARERGHAIKRVTVSGVGEPLHNHENVSALLSQARAERIGLSLTTSGGPLPRLREWLRKPHNGLTVSVHAGTEGTRARLVPRGPPLGELFEVLAEEVPALTRARRKKTALAYLAVAGENDSDDEVDAFSARACKTGLAVHLYAFNPVPTSGLRPVSRTRYEEIYASMVRTGLVVRMGSSARTETNGGCGTLVAISAARERGAAAPSG